MKKRYLLMGITAILVATTIVGGSLAATNATGETASNTLAAPTLSVGLSGTATKSLEVSAANRVMPGDQLQGSFTVKNNADVSQFVRVTVTKYWKNADGSKNVQDDTANLAFTWSSGSWTQAADPFAGDAGMSQEQYVYYYQQVLDAGVSTPVSFTIGVDQKLGNQYQNTGIALDVSVDAVQYVSGDDALNADGILSAWGVTAQVSGKKISSVA